MRIFNQVDWRKLLLYLILKGRFGSLSNLPTFRSPRAWASRATFGSGSTYCCKLEDEETHFCVVDCATSSSIRRKKESSLADISN